MPIVHSSLDPVPLDPYLDWAIKNDFRHHRQGNWVPMLVRFDTALQEGDSAATALQNFTLLNWLDADLKQFVRIPELFMEPPRVIAQEKGFNFCVLFVNKSNAGVVTNSTAWRKKIVSMSFSPPFDPPKPREAAPRNAPAPAPAPRLSLLCRIAQFFQRFFESQPSRNRQRGALSVFGKPRLDALPMEEKQPIPRQTKSGAPGTAGNSASAVRAVAVAVLDEGIAFAHERFRMPSGQTRIRFLWNQNGMVGGSGLGTEITDSEIDSEIALHATGPEGEQAVYRALGGLDYSKDGYKPLGRRKSHGMHVASIATKVQPAVSSDQRPVIAVELPEVAIADPVGCDLYAYVALGLFYAMKRVELSLSGGAGMPLVCNLSYGPHDGPHDGTDDLELFVDWLVRVCHKWPLEVVMAAGNFRQSRAHALFDVAGGDSKVLHWRIQPDDQRPSFIEIWCPTDKIDAVTVTATSPLGASRSVSLLQPEDHEQGPNGPVFWMWITPYDMTSPPARVQILIGVQPTATDPPLDTKQPTASAGLWKITVRSTADVKLEAWIGRKMGGNATRRKGRQSYFDDPNYQRFEQNSKPRELDPAVPGSYVTRIGTLSGIATGKSSYVVGACYRSTELPTTYTSSGPTSGGNRIALSPNFVAAGEDSRFLRGVLAAGTRSGTTVAMNGSSVAAPQFTHCLAEFLATGSAPTIAPPPAGVPQEVIGAGTLVYPSNWYMRYRSDRPTF